ncbi:hypothetical protein C8Q75DRAFT_808970 [Abortiporus biennis]|nr:hypothetical protein C8Q75DRAFT_808970 [Abortiporus biennis]
MLKGFDTGNRRYFTAKNILKTSENLTSLLWSKRALLFSDQVEVHNSARKSLVVKLVNRFACLYNRHYHEPGPLTDGKFRLLIYCWTFFANPQDEVSSIAYKFMQDRMTTEMPSRADQFFNEMQTVMAQVLEDHDMEMRFVMRNCLELVHKGLMNWDLSWYLNMLGAFLKTAPSLARIDILGEDETSLLRCLSVMMVKQLCTGDEDGDQVVLQTTFKVINEIIIHGIDLNSDKDIEDVIDATTLHTCLKYLGNFLVDAVTKSERGNMDVVSDFMDLYSTIAERYPLFPRQIRKGFALEWYQIRLHIYTTWSPTLQALQSIRMRPHDYRQTYVCKWDAFGRKFGLDMNEEFKHDHRYERRVQA